MSRLRSESGFTIPELLITMVMAMIISLATFTLIEIVMKRSGEVAARVETTASARTAMDQITRQLRSQVCVKTSPTSPTRSLVAASPTSITVYTDFSAETLTNGLLPAPDQRKVNWSANGFTEIITKGTRNSNNTVTYPSTPTATRPFLSNVVPVVYASNAGKPDTSKPFVFRYYRFPDTPDGSSILPTGSTANIEVIGANADRSLTDTQLATVAMVRIDFKVVPKAGYETAATTLQNQIYVRTTDPNAQAPDPTCLTY